MGMMARLALRGVATVLVMFGVGCTKKPANDGPATAPTTPTTPAQSGEPPIIVPLAEVDSGATPEGPVIAVAETLPDRIDDRIVQKWLEHHAPQSSWTTFKKQATKSQLEGAHIRGVPPVFEKVFTATGPVAVADAILALDKAEADGLFDHWLAAHLWRRTTAPSAAFYARIQEHARITDALLLARGQVKPPTISPKAWRSKAGPSTAIRTSWAVIVRDVHKIAKDEYPRTEPGSWKKDGVALLSPVPDTKAPSIIQGGKTLLVGQNTRFGRLDLIVTPKDSKTAVTHAWLGRVDLPAATTISVWSIDAHLSDDTTKKVAASIKAALAGDEKAALELERAMPFAHAALRAALTASPSAKGAPRLRTILALFDDVAMPPPVDLTPKSGLTPDDPF